MIRPKTARPLYPALGILFLAGACGGGGSSPVAPATPVAAATPAPFPTPTPVAQATPNPAATPCTAGLCEEPTTNTAPVVRAVLRLYQLFDPNEVWVLPTPDPFEQVVRQPIPVGYTIRLDLVGKDATNKDTHGQKEITFFYSDDSMVAVSIQSDWQRKLKVVKPGKFTVYALYDGVGSNDLRFTFVE